MNYPDSTQQFDPDAPPVRRRVRIQTEQSSQSPGVGLGARAP